MNIFVLSGKPKTAAKMHCDKHLVKMIVELYQQMGSALRRHGATDEQMPLTQGGTPLKGGYRHHPCTIWCGDTRTNFKWAGTHANALCKEYTHRYNKIHFCQDPIHHMINMSNLIPKGKRTKFIQAMPAEYKNVSAIKAYREYYLFDKKMSISMTWTKRKEPYWWK